jgi:hypothetical protein
LKKFQFCENKSKVYKKRSFVKIKKLAKIKSTKIKLFGTNKTKKSHKSKIKKELHKNCNSFL